MSGGLLQPLVIPLKSQTQAYSDSLALISIQHWGTRDIRGGTELPEVTARAVGAAFSRIEVLTKAFVPLLNPAPIEPAGGCHF